MTIAETSPHFSRTVGSRTEAIDALTACAEVCTSCADACLDNSTELEMLRRCIRLNFDCAGVCILSAELLARQTDTSDLLVRAQLQACIIACQLCAEECMLHAARLQPCRICAEVCRQCSESCHQLLEGTSPATAAVYGPDFEDYTHPFDNPGL